MRSTSISLFVFLLLASHVEPAMVFADAGGQDSTWTGPNWDRDLALQAAARVDTEKEAEKLLRLTKSGTAENILRAVREIEARPDWPEPARESVLLRFAEKLRVLPAFTVEADVLDFLLGYPNRVLVAHEESPQTAVPLFPIRATAAGLVHQWTRQQATLDALDLIIRDPQQLVEVYLRSLDPNIRAGIETAVATTSPSALQSLLDRVMPRLSTEPMLTGLAGAAALKTRDLPTLSRVLNEGSGPALVTVSRQASQQFSAGDLETLLKATKDRAPASTTAMLMSGRSKPVTSKPDSKSMLLRTDPGSYPMAEEGSIVAWTETGGPLALGYPVPIPVDTPLPFDGFRSYSGLHTRHQDLAATTSIVHGEVVGTTHNGREIWAYRIGDADLLDWEGRPEAATLTNGGIHAREWQTPEVATGIMELFAGKQGDHYFYDFLLENVNMVLLPVQNVDGFVQTQRYPTQNWLKTDPFDPVNDPQPSPRDGRMRRKNMPGVDEILATREDHLFGIDLNRNNPPFWSTNPNRSSSDNRSLVYHGTAPRSEPESQALMAAAALGPESQLRAFTDVHSYSQEFYYVSTTNPRLTKATRSLLYTMSLHHASLPNGRTYLINAISSGFGMTNEWFSSHMEIPSWGVEVEPSVGQPGIPGQPPGCAADYGGLATNCHDGFILPESQIRRVREQLALSFAAAYYQQAGPPSIAAVRFVDTASQAVIFEAEWDPAGDNQRALYVNQVQPLELGRDYTFWIAYDRPMRWREAGEIARFPGQLSSTLDFFAGGFLGDSPLSSSQVNPRWIDTPGDAPDGYFRYQDDSLAAEFSLPRDDTNLGLITSERLVTLHNMTDNMTGQALDANPATPVTWAQGGWSGYEDNDGADTDKGGTDMTIKFAVTPDAQPEPFVVEPGVSSAWFDPGHDGEGFLIEILENDRAVMYWFTFDDEGEQAWYLAAGEVRGNRLVFPELVQTSGGIFGPDFDPDTVTRKVVGSATFLYETCSSGSMVYQLPGRKGRFKLQRLSRVMGANCGGFLGPPVVPESVLSGSWYNPAQDGHGFVIEVLFNQDVLVYWFTYDQAGKQAWFLGVGGIENGALVISEVFQTRGPAFGPDFDPDDLELIPWGEMRFDLSCNSGSVSFDGTPAGFGAGQIDLERLSSLAGLACGD